MGKQFSGEIKSLKKWLFLEESILGHYWSLLSIIHLRCSFQFLAEFPFSPTSHDTSYCFIFPSSSHVPIWMWPLLFFCHSWELPCFWISRILILHMFPGELKTQQVESICQRTRFDEWSVCKAVCARTLISHTNRKGGFKFPSLFSALSRQESCLSY